MIRLKRYVGTISFKVLNQPLKTVEIVQASSAESAKNLLQSKYSKKGRQLISIKNLKLIKKV